MTTDLNKIVYSRNHVISLIADLLDRPDVLIDAVSNENTDWDAASLLWLAEESVFVED